MRCIDSWRQSSTVLTNGRLLGKINDRLRNLDPSTLLYIAYACICRLHCRGKELYLCHCLHELIGVAEAIFMKNTSYFTFCVTVSLCPVWHSSVTAAQMKALESLQRRAMRIIFQDSDYMMSLTIAGLDTLESRRDQLTERFFQRSVLPETSCLHYLLPDKRDASVTDRLRHARNFEHSNLELLNSEILLFHTV